MLELNLTHNNQTHITYFSGEVQKGGEDGREQEAGAGFVDHAPCKDRGEQEAAGFIDRRGTAGARV